MKTKRLLYLFLLLVLCNDVKAQLPDGSMAPDIVANDIFGNPHSIHDYLGDGYTVVLHIMTAWCGPCFAYHSNDALKDLYNEFGPDGEDKVMVLMVEGDASTAPSDLYGTGFGIGDFVTGTPYPIIDEPSATSLYALSYYPTIFRICPSDSTLTELGQITGTALETAVFEAGCALPAEPECNDGNPISGVTSSVGSSDVTLSWNTVPGSIGCQVRARPVGSASLLTFPILGSEISSVDFPVSNFPPGSFEWSVKCLCSLSPWKSTDYSASDLFTIPAARKGIANAAIWPNPATNFIHVSISDDSFQTYRLLNSHGKLVLENQLLDEQQIDVSDLPVGVYYMQLISPLETQIETIVVSGK